MGAVPPTAAPIGQGDSVYGPATVQRIQTQPSRASSAVQSFKGTAEPRVRTAAVEERPDSGSEAAATVQLGAFESEGQANSAWRSLSSRFSFLAGSDKMLVPYNSGSRHLVRLRAGVASEWRAGKICEQLKAADENCFVVR
jgi:hypothetical protein